ncbi:MAG TPA: RodZ domain-containing protein [Candidatus Nanoarchaeia archaeon]
MRTVGEILIESRNKKKLTLDQVERETKIRKKILQLLEEGNWDTLSPTYTKGLLKNYVAYLGLEQRKILAFFRREYDERKETTVVKRLDKLQPRFRFTPASVTVVLIAGLVAAVVLYLFFQYRSFTAAPRLEIQEPADNIKISSLEVNVVGKTWSDAILKINGEKVQISPGGSFSVAVSLKEGVNKLTITSANRFGKINTKTRTIIVEPPKKPIAGASEKKNVLHLQLKVPTKSVFLEVAVDGKTVFQGLMLVGSSKNFEGRERIKIVTENAGATLVKIGDKEFVLGKEGERVEREFTHND